MLTLLMLSLVQQLCRDVVELLLIGKPHIDADVVTDRTATVTVLQVMM